MKSMPRVVRVLIDNGADVNATYNNTPYLNNETPLETLLGHLWDTFPDEAIECMSLLVNTGVDIVNVRNGRTPASVLLMSFYEKVYDGLSAEHYMTPMSIMWKALVERGALLSRSTENGTTYAHLAAQLNDTELLNTFIAHGGNVDTFSEEMGRALHVATGEGNLQLLQRLLQHGAHIDAASVGGGNAFERIVSIGVAETVGFNALLPLHCLCAQQIEREELPTRHLSRTEQAFLSLHSVRNGN